MSRYELAPDHINAQVQKVKSSNFPELKNATVLTLLDTQKRRNQGRYVEGSISTASSMVNTLAEAYTDTEFDYMLKLDKAFFESLSSEDQEAVLIYHLSRCMVETKNEKPRFAVAAYDFQTTQAFVDKDPKWMAWLSRMAKQIAQVHEARDPVHSGQEGLDLCGDQDDHSKYYNETEDALIADLEARGHTLPEGFKEREDDEERMRFLVEFLESDDVARRSNEDAA